jgi:hypothetical protein
MIFNLFSVRSNGKRTDQSDRQHSVPAGPRPPAIYLDRRKVSSQFHSPDGTTSILDTEAFVTYVISDDLHRSKVTC